MIYLDYNATTPLAPEALEAMRPYLERHFGNPSSIHAAGREARAAIDDARDRLARLLGAKPHEIIFTGGGTESDNLAVIGLARSARRRGQASDHLRHRASRGAARVRAFAKAGGLPRDVAAGRCAAGASISQQLADALTPETTLVSIMSANNETGTLPADRAKSPRSAASAACSFTATRSSPSAKSRSPRATSTRSRSRRTSFTDRKARACSTSRAGLSIERLQHGGSHENERRAGTENVAAIVGMARAAELRGRAIWKPKRARQAALRDRLWSGIRDGVSRRGAERRSRRIALANTLNVSFPGLDGESLLMNLDLAGICASSGSACMVGSIVPSHVLLAMGVPPELAACDRALFARQRNHRRRDRERHRSACRKSSRG